MLIDSENYLLLNDLLPKQLLTICKLKSKTPEELTDFHDKIWAAGHDRLEVQYFFWPIARTQPFFTWNQANHPCKFYCLFNQWPIIDLNVKWWPHSFRAICNFRRVYYTERWINTHRRAFSRRWKRNVIESKIRIKFV